MTTTTDQRDELAKVLKEAIRLMEKFTEIERDYKSVDYGSRCVGLADDMKEFIEKWKI